MFEPRPETSLLTESLTPSPMAMMATTAPTPMMMPSMVRKLRSLAALRLMKAILMFSMII